MESGLCNLMLMFVGNDYMHIFIHRSVGSDGSFIVPKIDFPFVLLSWNILTLCIHVMFFASWPTLLCGEEKFTSQQHKQLSPTFISRQRARNSHSKTWREDFLFLRLDDSTMMCVNLIKEGVQMRAFPTASRASSPHCLLRTFIFQFTVKLSSWCSFCSIVETEKFSFFSKQEREHKKFHASVMSRFSSETFWDILDKILDLSAEAFLANLASLSKILFRHLWISWEMWFIPGFRFMSFLSFIYEFREWIICKFCHLDLPCKLETQFATKDPRRLSRRFMSIRHLPKLCLLLISPNRVSQLSRVFCLEASPFKSVTA